MPDIDLYQHSTNDYESLQEKRPDYTGAIKAFLELTIKNIKYKENINISDFCCGTGNNSKLISQEVSLNSLTLIDINKEFLDIALLSNIPAKNINIINSDILDVALNSDNDLVISMFAYHHVPDNRKEKYLEIVKSALIHGGLLILGEIYSPNKDTTIKYYNHLLNSIDENIKTPELEKFLKQTAESDDFEYKVSRDFAHNQLKNLGFELIDCKKIWPNDDMFADDVGTFVEVWRMI